MIVNLSADSLFDPTTLDFNEETFDDATLLREGFENVIDRYADTQVTHIFLNANYQRTCYQSKVWSSFWDIPEPDPKGSGWMLAWRAVRAGVDVFEICIQRCREKGISPWLSMRMNDWHNLHNPEIACPRWWEHPELRLSPKGTFDFAHSEVRDYHFELVVEFLQQYEIDGVELDWMRGPPFFKPDQAEAGCKWLTEFMRNVRQAADRCSDRLGRKLGIAVRVPGVPEHAAGFGLDAVTWAREGLVDILIPTAVWMPTDFDMPMEAWREQIGARDRPFRLAAGSDLWVRCTSNGAKMKSTPESLRGFSASMLSRGADAIYLFNHFNEPKDFRFFLQADDGNRTVERTHKELLSEGGEMETAMAGPRRHVLTLRNTVPPGIEFDEPLPRMVGAGSSETFHIHTGPAGREGKGVVRVGLDGEGALASADLKVELNGSATIPVEDLTDRSRSVPPEHEGDGVVWNVADTALRMLQFEFPLSALRQKHNEIKIRSARDETWQVVWLEVFINC